MYTMFRSPSSGPALRCAKAISAGQRKGYQGVRRCVVDGEQLSAVMDEENGYTSRLLSRQDMKTAGGCVARRKFMAPAQDLQYTQR